MTDKMREVFEKMALRFCVTGDELKQDEDGFYLNEDTQSHWVVFGIAWAESRADVVVTFPLRTPYVEYFDDVEGGCFNYSKYLSDVQSGIRAQGLNFEVQP